MTSNNAFLKGAFLIISIIFAQIGTAQVAINLDGSDPDPSAMLDVKSTEKGFLLPRMTEIQRLDVMSPATGLIVYQMDGASGFYYYDGTQWALMGDAINASGYDNIFLNNLVVDGSQCVGLDCVDSEDFDLSTIRMKENNTRIEFLDTSTDPGDPSNDWMIEANESINGGRNAFIIRDLTHSQRIFWIEANAGENAFYIAAGGYAGLGTDIPTERLHVQGSAFIDGNITATGTIMSVSDSRLKKDINHIENAMQVISAWNPTSYRFRTNEFKDLNLPEGRQYGLLAQEVSDVTPNLVNKLNINMNGLDDVQGVNYTGMIPVLIAGAQEQETAIREKEIRIADLEQEVAEIEAMVEDVRQLTESLQTRK